MSTDTGLGTRLRNAGGGETDEGTVDDLLPGDLSVFRAATLAAVLVLTWAYVVVLWDVARVVGGSDLILPLVVAVVAAATVVARYISPRVAAGVALVFTVVGYAYYLTVTPAGLALVVAQTDALIADALALLTGLPIIRMIRADVWALAFAPGPAFFSWYLAMRRRYVASVAVGGIALGFLVLTSDAGNVVTLAGVLSGTAAVGFGELDRRDGTLLQADVLVVLVVLILVTSLGAAAFAGSGANPISPSTSGIGGGTATVEGTLVGAGDRTTIVGSISLSPEVRFTVEADEERYWRTGVYDRYTGQGWVRTGREQQYQGPLSEPQGPRRTVVQTYTVESRVATMPAAAEPVRVVGTASEATLVTRQGTLKPDSTFIEDDKYRVFSQVPAGTPEQLRAAGTDYPDRIEEQYTELPEDTPSRVGDLTDRVTAPADNPYDSAALIEEFLERNKSYSLEVDRPSGQVADSFLFEMEAGYCTYFATTMVVMLRSQGIPARMAVGYTPGQQISEDEWVVRGLNSHAWVEVYFPDHGWVKFDPTPGGPRQSTELDRIETARESGGGGNIDTEESEDQPLTTTTTTVSTNETTAANITGIPANRSPTLPPFAQGTTINGTGNVTAGTDSANGGNPLPPLPSREQTALALLLLLGAAAGAHRTGLTGYAYQTVRMHWQGRRESPEADVVRAYERLEILLARRYRPRRPGETPRQYVESLSIAGVGGRIEEITDTYERARYAGDVDPEAADEAVSIVDALVRETIPVVGRFA